MGLLKSLFEKRWQPSQPTDTDLAFLGAGLSTAAGVDVSPEGALRHLAVYACVRVLAESVASLPLIVYARGDDGSKQRADSFPLYTLLHDAPNPEMTALEFRETLMGHLALRGNAYAEIEWLNSGRPGALWPLRPDRVKPVRNGKKELVYEVRLSSGEVRTLAARQVLHIRGLGPNGLIGYDPISIARQAIGLGLGTEEFGARFFANDARPGIVLEYPGKLGKEAQDRLRDSWSDRHQGLSNAHRIAVLEEGMKVTEIGIAPENAQFLETRKFQVNEIARMFRVPPHMIADLDRSTNNNIEHQGLEFVTHTLRPWLVRWEQRINQTLLVGQERQRYFAEFLVDGLLRGDIKSRYDAYAVARQNGWMSANDVRTKENMNPIPNGDVYLVPLNMIPTGQVGRAERVLSTEAETRQLSQPERRAGTDQLAASRQTLVRAQVPVLEDIAGRVTRRETNDIRRAVQKFLRKANDLAGFLLWLDEFYREHAGFVERNFGPAIESIGMLVLQAVSDELGQDSTDKQRQQVISFVSEYVGTLGQRWSISGKEQLMKLAEAEVGAALADTIDERLDGWDETTPGKVGRREATRTVNAIARAGYIAFSVSKLRWYTSGAESCPYCDSLNGKVVGIDTPFLPAGNFHPDGADGPLLVRRNTFNPPAHDGCDCVIFAEG